MRWRGKFSPGDKKTWNSELKDALNYDPAVAVRHINIYIYIFIYLYIYVYIYDIYNM